MFVARRRARPRPVLLVAAALLSVTLASSSSAMGATATGGGSLVVSPWTLTGGGSAMGTVTLAAPAPSGGASVALTSSSPGVASLPSSVFIGAGQTSQSFTLTTQTVPASTPVTVGASYGSMAWNGVVTVKPKAPSISLSLWTLVGGGSVQGTVTLAVPAPGSGAVVNLATNSSSVSVPSSVTVAGGSKTASFTASTQPVATTTAVTLTATYDGMARSGVLTLKPRAPTISLNPWTVVGGNSVAGTVALAVPAPAGGATVILTRSPSAVASLPGTVVVPAGSTTAAFTVATQPVAASTPVTVTAGYDGMNRSVTLTVNPRPPTLSLSPWTLMGGNPAQGTVTLALPAPAGGTTVTLASAAPAVASVPPSVAVPAGTTSASFSVTTQMPGGTTGVAVTAAIPGASKTVTLTVLSQGGGGGGGGSGSAANLWVNLTAGASPTRCATPCAFDATRAYGSVAAAWAAAQGGDVVMVKGGTYASGFSASGGKGSTVTVKSAPGENAWFAGDGSLEGVSNMLVSDERPSGPQNKNQVGQGLTIGYESIGGGSSNISFQGIDAWCQNQPPWHIVIAPPGSTHGNDCAAFIELGDTTNFSMRDGSIGPTSACYKTGCANNAGGGSSKITGCSSNAACDTISFTRVWWHDVYNLDRGSPAPGDVVHLEAFKLDQGQNITFSNDLWTNCDCDTAVLFLGQSEDKPTADRITITGNVFAQNLYNTSIAQGYCSPTPCTPTLTLQYNTLSDGLSLLDGLASYTNITLTGNLAYRTAFAYGGCSTTNNNNTWYTPAGVGQSVLSCPGDNQSYANLDLTGLFRNPGPNGDYQLVANPPAGVVNGGGTGCLGLTDIAGTGRPLGGACDSGAYELS